MSIQALVGYGFTLSIFLGVVAVGMRVAPADLSYVLSKPARLARSLLAMNVLAPIAAVVVCKVFSLHPAVIVALVTLSIAPLGSLFSRAMLPLVAEDHRAYARGLLFASAVLSVVLTPLAVEGFRYRKARVVGRRHDPHPYRVSIRGPERESRRRSHRDELRVAPAYRQDGRRSDHLHPSRAANRR